MVSKRVFNRGRQEDPFILVVENIDKEGVQMLGSDLGIDPCFFAHHFRRAGFHQYKNVLKKVRSDFLSFLDHQNDGQVSTYATAGPFIEASYLSASLGPKLHTQHPEMSEDPRISCYRVSKYGCTVHSP